MAVAFDAVGPSSSGQTGTLTSITWTHTAVASGVAIIVAVGYGHSVGLDGTLGATCGGAAMTALGTVNSDNIGGASSAGKLTLFGIANQGSGAHTMVVTVTSGPATRTIETGSVSYSGADTSSPFGAAVTAFGSSTAPAVTVTGTAATSMVAAAAAIGSSTLTNPATGRWVANFSNSNSAGCAGQADKAGGGSVTFTWSDTTSDDWGAIGVEVKAPAGGAAAGTVQPAAARPAARRRLARALVQFRPVAGANATPPAGTVQPRPTIPVPRRRPTRALARGTAVPGVRTAAPRQLFQMPPRRRRARAVVRFTPVAGANATVPRTLLLSLASAAGVDDYGNAYPQGIFASAGVIQGPEFVGSDYVSNQDGSFYYSGPAAFGNLISSVAAAAGVDAQGNAFLQGTVSYLPGGTCSAVAITGGAVAWFTAPGPDGPWSEVGVMEIALTGGNPLVFSFSSLGGNINMPQNAPFGVPLASPAPSAYNVVWGTQIVTAINNLYSMLQAAGVTN